MSEILLTFVVLAACWWPAVFLLTWRDSRRKAKVVGGRVVHLPVIGHPVFERAAVVRDFGYWGSMVVTGLVTAVLVVLFWPVLVFGWGGMWRRERRRYGGGQRGVFGE